MSRWQRLSGYLHTKPTGPFRRLKGSQKNWYVFDESSMMLRAYRSEEEANTPNREPIRVINIVNAAFYIDPAEFHQFVITSEGKECVLQAETEEAMMLWLDTLQTRRNEAIRNDLESLLQDESACITERRRQPKISTSKLPPSIVRSTSVVSYDVSDIQCTSPAKPWRVGNVVHLSTSSVSSSRPTTPINSMDSSFKTSPTLMTHHEFRSPEPFSQQVTGEINGFPPTTETSLPAVQEVPFENNKTLDDEDEVDKFQDTETSPAQPLLISTPNPIPEKYKGYSVGPRLYATGTRVFMPSATAMNENVFSRPDELSLIMQKDSVFEEKSPEATDKGPLTDADFMKTSDYSDSIKRDSNSSDSFRAEERPLGYRQAAFLMTIRDLQAQLDASLERESSLRHMLASREAAMAELDHRISQIEELEERKNEFSIPENTPAPTLRNMLIDMEKKQRVLAKKVQFLISEVQDLSAVQHMLTDHGSKQVRYTRKLSSDVLQWKYDYVKLLESCLGAFRVDNSHGLMFGDYGRTKVK